MKYAWIDKMADRRLWWFSVALACEVLEVSRSGFYDWRARRQRPATPGEREQQLLLAAITVEHIASKRRYGSPRIHAELVDQGWQVGVNRIARLMALHGIQGRSGRLRRRNLTRQATVGLPGEGICPRYNCACRCRSLMVAIAYLPVLRMEVLRQPLEPGQSPSCSSAQSSNGSTTSSSSGRRCR